MVVFMTLKLQYLSPEIYDSEVRFLSNKTPTCYRYPVLVPLTIDSVFQSYSRQALPPRLPCSHPQKTKTLNTERPTLCFLVLDSGTKPHPHFGALGFKCLRLCVSLSLCLFITSPPTPLPHPGLVHAPLAGRPQLSITGKYTGVLDYVH